MSKHQMKLGAFLKSYGHHVAAWRHPDATTVAGGSFADYADMAQIAERGLFDMLFFADIATVHEGSPDVASRNSMVVRLEPFTLLSALSAVTRRIGLVCTSSSTYDDPYHIARRFATLDVITGGRSGWNLVTSMHASEALNFSRNSHLKPEQRYRRAREFAQVVKGLWDSWDDDAFVCDKDSGIFFEADKMHILDHAGEEFQVRGPLTVPRSPQGQPVIVQAGSSEEGKNLAAETAEVVFTAQQTLAEAQAFYADVKGRLAKYGREPDDIKIMPGIFPTVGRTQQEAQAKYDELQSLIDPKVGLMQLSAFMGFDLSGYPVDGPLPELPEKVRGQSRPALLSNLAQREHLSIRQLYMRMAGGRGHSQIIGTPATIADSLEDWFTSGAADGFNILPPLLPGSLSDFVELVIPELQRRKLFRKEYDGATLRENLELRRPVSRYANEPAIP